MIGFSLKKLPQKAFGEREEILLESGMLDDIKEVLLVSLSDNYIEINRTMSSFLGEPCWIKLVSFRIKETKLIHKNIQVQKKNSVQGTS